MVLFDYWIEVPRYMSTSLATRSMFICEVNSLATHSFFKAVRQPSVLYYSYNRCWRVVQVVKRVHHYKLQNNVVKRYHLHLEE